MSATGAVPSAARAVVPSEASTVAATAAGAVASARGPSVSGTVSELIVAIIVVLAACGGAKRGARAAAPSETAQPRVTTAAERLLGLLPDPQVVIELDLARLRANPVIGALMTRVLARPPELPGAAPIANLGDADVVVFASYALGTSQAATVTLVAAKTDMPGATRISDGTYAFGPADRIALVEARVAAAHGTELVASRELLALRDRAMPARAPGASLRITARLPFDARIALARQTGIESAPSQLSLWADVVDDFAVVVDADATDPGDRTPTKAAARLASAIRGALRDVASEPVVRALGLPSAIASARLVTGGSWVRTVIAIGPRHLQRVVERADQLLAEGASS